MMQLYLRTDTEAEMIEALPWARGTDRDGNGVWITSSHDYALDVIGPLCLTPATYDADYKPLTPPVMDGRFHVNLRYRGPLGAKIPSSIRIPAPETPKRGWL
jgi:hypothetical protein